MKKKLLLIGAMLLAGSIAFSQGFTSGNLVVYRYGNGATYTNGELVPVFLDEYNTSGNLVKTRAVPTVTNGVNKGLTGLLKLAATGKYQEEGASTLSQDGKYITIFGYNAAVGSTAPNAADGLVVGVIAADGSLNTTTTLSSDPTTGLGAPRSAVIDGTNIWANGFTNGVQYTTLGSTSSTRISVNQNAPRTLSIINNSLIAPIGTFSTLAYASPLPTTSTTFITRAGLGSGVTINQVIEFQLGTRRLMYAVDDATGTIRRYYTNSTNTDWISFGTNISSSPNTDLVKSITGVLNVVGANTEITLYLTTWGNDGTGTGSSRLITFKDTYLTPTGAPAAPTATTAVTTLATAPAGTVFRSVTMAPQGSSAIGTATLPVSLVSFQGKKVESGIQLSWVTSSERNNSYFDIMRSSDGKKFEKIKAIDGNGNSNNKITYSFTDENPVIGTNYYQLKQIDFNGSFSLSDIIAVQSGLEIADLKVFSRQNSDELEVIIHSAHFTNADLIITDLTGRKIKETSLKLSKGNNSFTIPVNAKNVLVVTLKTATGNISKKIIK
ncbi:hypothetical protein FYC62_08630 [Pedobacter aquae]|uniref:Secreted protein (Por secretion system target) n=1 Tax=Pedobacter aquae TaxID=2605747 RepID=A0A5C0VG52_9SPHI|nr:hypothetical protein [Pedobacter aquae]QEK51718.1 hypothetical protein FYC62_08630 [Pedobacter aquae]